MQIINTFYYGNFQQKALIINIALRLRMSAYAYAKCEPALTVDLIRRSWVRIPPRSKDFFFASCGSLFPFTRAKVIHGFK